jgi:hypothetical protein
MPSCARTFLHVLYEKTSRFACCGGDGLARWPSFAGSRFTVSWKYLLYNPRRALVEGKAH